MPAVLEKFLLSERFGSEPKNIIIMQTKDFKEFLQSHNDIKLPDFKDESPF